MAQPTWTPHRVGEWEIWFVGLGCFILGVLWATIYMKGGANLLEFTILGILTAGAGITAGRAGRHGLALLRHETQGISPLIAVILMIAVTIILAAVLFLMVEWMTHGGGL